VRIIIDASVALKWVFDEPGSQDACALREDQLIAPTLWLVEAANALWRRVRINDITAERASARLAELLNAPVASLPIEPHLDAALRLATELNHPVYDCLYLAVAIEHNTYVVTADRRFAAIAEQPEFADHIRLLGV
jgi:predicted nucleic acid-binding protein